MAEIFVDPIPTAKTEAIPVTTTKFRDASGRFVSTKELAEALVDVFEPAEVQAFIADPGPSFEPVAPPKVDEKGNPAGGARTRSDGLLFDEKGNLDGGETVRDGLRWDRRGNPIGRAE